MSATARPSAEPPFTSDLSCADFALARGLGVEPIRQVLGACVYQVGYQSLMAYETPYSGMPMFGGGDGYVTRLDVITEAWNNARERALSRLRGEAEAVGAQAVVGVSLRAVAEHLGEGGGAYAIDYSVIGTAIRHGGRAAAGARRSSPPQVVLTELSVADYAKLLRAGVEPVGIAAHSVSVFATYGYNTVQRMRAGGAGAGAFGIGGECFELREYSAALYAARGQVEERMRAAASELGAEGVVGVRLERSFSRPQLGGQATGLIVSLHAIGTAVAATAGRTAAAQAAAAQAAVMPTIDLLHGEGKR